MLLSLQESIRDGLSGNNALIAMNHIAHASWQVSATGLLSRSTHWQLGEHNHALGVVAAGLRLNPDFCDLQVVVLCPQRH
eukprot:747704-Hanusia_phi.AAC.3